MPYVASTSRKSMRELWRKEKEKGVITNSKMTVIFVFISFFLVDGAAHYLRHIVPFRSISQLEKYKKGPTLAIYG